jgi:hypothetical protein
MTSEKTTLSYGDIADRYHDVFQRRSPRSSTDPLRRPEEILKTNSILPAPHIRGPHEGRRVDEGVPDDYFRRLMAVPALEPKRS